MSQARAIYGKLSSNVHGRVTELRREHEMLPCHVRNPERSFPGGELLRAACAKDAALVEPGGVVLAYHVGQRSHCAGGES